jgi:hypothetical protein
MPVAKKPSSVLIGASGEHYVLFELYRRGILRTHIDIASVLEHLAQCRTTVLGWALDNARSTDCWRSSIAI